MKKIVSLVLFLAIVSAVSGVILGYVNSITAPIIEANSMAAEKAYLEAMFPGAEVTIVTDQVADDVVKGAYIAEGQGYAFNCEANGFAGPVKVLVGMDNDGTIIAITPLEHGETAGFGAENFTEESIATFYLGKTIDQEVDMRAGSTFTSNAMKTITNAAKEAFKKLG